MRSYASWYNGDGPLVLNKRLLPLTLGHVIHLTNVDSLFLRNFKLKLPETKPELVAFTIRIMDELGKAIAICSMTFDEYSQWQWNVKAKKKWFKQFSQDIEALHSIGKLDLLDSVYLINDYVTEAHRLPKFVITPKKGNTPQVPTAGVPEDWYVPLVHSLCTAYHLSKTDILNQPLQLSIMDFYHNAQANGEGRLLGPDEDSYIETIRTKNVTPEMKQKLAETLAKHMSKRHGR